MRYFDAVVKAMVFLCTLVALYAFTCAMFCGCAAPVDATGQPVDDAGPDAMACYPQEPGAKIACQEVCQINLRSHNALDSGVFDYNACLSGCDCVSPCVPLMWVDTQFLPCDVACADAGDACINACSCVSAE